MCVLPEMPEYVPVGEEWVIPCHTGRPSTFVRDSKRLQAAAGFWALLGQTLVGFSRLLFSCVSEQAARTGIRDYNMAYFSSFGKAELKNSEGDLGRSPRISTIRSVSSIGTLQRGCNSHNAFWALVTSLSSRLSRRLFVALHIVLGSFGRTVEEEDSLNARKTKFELKQMPMVADPHFYHATLGALLIGFSVSCGVFGVLSQQTMTYYQRYFHDKIVYKLMVGFLWFFQCIDVVLVGYSVYHYTITHYGDFAYLITQDVLWSLIVQILLAALVGTAVKCAFALRVWTFSKKNVYVTGGIVCLIVAQTGFALAYCVKAFEIRKLKYASQLRTIATLSLAAGVVTDLAIAMALCYFLRKLRTGFKKSDSLVNMLCIYAINTGALTAAVSATVLILYNVYPEYLYFMGSYFVLGNLYAISFICTLNTRRVIRGAGTDNQNSTSENSRGGPIFMITNPSNGNRPSHAGNNMSPTSIMSKGQVDINVRREITVLTDIESQEHTLDADTPAASPSPIKSVSPFR